jgi:hypothetical protein
MASRKPYVGMFQTNSPVSCAKVAESLRPAEEKPMMGGRSLKALKNE